MANIDHLFRQFRELGETSPDALIFGLALLSAVLFFVLLVGLIFAPHKAPKKDGEADPIVHADFAAAYTSRHAFSGETRAFEVAATTEPAVIRLPRRIGLRSE